MSKLHLLIEWLKRYEITGEPHIEKEIEELKKEINESLKLQELLKNDSNLSHDKDCIHNQGTSKCVNCHVRTYIEFLIEESEKK